MSGRVERLDRNKAEMDSQKWILGKSRCHITELNIPFQGLLVFEGIYRELMVKFAPYRDELGLSVMQVLLEQEARSVEGGSYSRVLSKIRTPQIRQWGVDGDCEIILEILLLY